jgi:CheY-like chemotaxis protein
LSGSIPEGQRGLFILVVDDNPDSLDIIKEAFEHASRVNVLTARSAEAALGMARVMVPDVVICDLSMPGKDGYWLIRHLRSLWSNHPRAVPAVAITAYRETHDRSKALRAGFDEYLEKPVDPFALLAVIGRIVAPLREGIDL